MIRFATILLSAAALLLSEVTAHAEEATEPERRAATMPGVDLAPTAVTTNSVELDLRVGAGVRRFSGLDTRGISAAAHLGAKVPRLYFAANAGIGFERAVTQGGLNVNVFSGELNASFMLDRFRIGMIPGLAWYRVERATTGASVGKLIPSLGLEASFTIVKFEGAEFYLSARGDLAFKATAAGASLGARF
jgi:hypothetical protein